MQSGWVERHAGGWRGVWREGGGRTGPKRRTRLVTKKREALALLDAALHPPLDTSGTPERVGVSITLGELIDRFQAQHPVSARTREKLRFAYQRPRGLWGDLAADAVTPEQINLWLVGSGLRASTRHSYLAALRQVYRFGVENQLISRDPSRRARTPAVRRAETLQPFRTWVEVERVAEETGRYAPFVILACDTGARPGELIRLEHSHIHRGRIHLPGTKTRNAQRTVALTPRGVCALRSIRPDLRTPRVFLTPSGQPINLHVWRARVWYPALALAGLAHRGPYQLRHTFAFFSLMAGVPIADLSVEMGHTNVTLTFQTYGHWANEMGDRAARLRDQWATGTHRGLVA